MGRFMKFLGDLTSRKCCVCEVKIVEDTVFYVAYPNDLYCKGCAERHPDFQR